MRVCKSVHENEATHKIAEQECRITFVACEAIIYLSYYDFREFVFLLLQKSWYDQSNVKATSIKKNPVGTMGV